MPSPSLIQSFQNALCFASQILSRSPKLLSQGVVSTESEVLVTASYRFVTGVSLSRIELYTKAHEPFPAAAAEKLTEWSEMRVEGKPLQHLTGTQFFLNHEYSVGPDVLVPRPETEVLVSLAIQKLSRCSRSPELGLEVGVGSGVISIELLSRFSDLTMLASELSESARARCISNAERILGFKGSAHLQVLSVERPEQVWEPFLRARPGLQADFLITNPPYLASPEEVDPEVLAFEPASALFAPSGDPLFFYREVAQRVREWIRPGGYVFAELPHERAEEIIDLFLKSHLEAEAFLDLNQRKRVMIARMRVRGKNG